MATVFPSTNVVVELLNKYNYESWSEVVRSYLVAHDLWDVVKPPQAKTEAVQITAEYREIISSSSASEEAQKSEDLDYIWKKDKKDAAALHAIQISCGPEALSVIRDVRSAQEAWHTLSKKFKPDFYIKFLARSQGGQQDYTMEKYKKFRDAVEKRDWLEAKELYTEHPSLLTAGFGKTNFTALHSAVYDKNELIVIDMVNQMNDEDLKIKESAASYTALALATVRGTVGMINCMVRKNPNLLSITDSNENIPLVLAAYSGSLMMVKMLYDATPIEFLLLDGGRHGAKFISICIKKRSSGRIDIATQLIAREKSLAIATDKTGNSPLYILARAIHLFHTSRDLKFWERWIYYSRLAESSVEEGKSLGQALFYRHRKSNKSSASTYLGWLGSKLLLKQAASTYLRWLASKLLLKIPAIHRYTKRKDLLHESSLALLGQMSTAIENITDKRTLRRNGSVFDALFAAVDRGNFEFVHKLTCTSPVLMASTDDYSRDMFMRAIENRQPRVFEYLVRQTDMHKSYVNVMEDKFGNNLLHIAATLAPSAQLNKITGAALQLQKEVQWYEEVKKIVHTSVEETENRDGMTPKEVFTRNHRELLAEGENWMKNVATSCSVVASLIVTMVFGAAFTVPGGETNRMFYKIFLIFDGLSLFSSTASVLVFLGILTSRYEVFDFRVKLPRILMIGLSSLFFSIATMLAAFSIVLLIMDTESWVPIPVILLAALPLTIFAVLQFPILIAIFKSTYGSKTFSLDLTE